MIDQIKKMRDAGLTLIPVKDKKPYKTTWRQYQFRQPTETEFREFDFSNGVALVCTKDIICIDLDCKNDKTGLIKRWKALVSFFDENLLKKLYCESTVNAGFHLVARREVPHIGKGNDHWAWDDGESACCIETRESGGYFVCAPTNGYKSLKGELDNLQTLSPDEIEILRNCAKDLDLKKLVEAPKKLPKIQNDLKKPWDDFNDQKGTEYILDSLQGRGWSVTGQQGHVTHLSRPDKSKGISASINHIPNCLYVFSSSTEFKPEKPYSPAQVRAVLEFGGSNEDCGKALYSEGYGERVRQKEKQEEKIKPKLEPAKYSDIQKEMFKVTVGDFEKGVSTGWNTIDQLYTVADHQLTIITGIPTHGKSTFADNLFVNLACVNNWRFLVYSPESYPLAVHWRSLAEKYLKQDMFGNSKENAIKACAFIEKHFVFVDCSRDDVTLEEILTLAREQKVNGLVIDPWNELEYEKPKGMSETDHIGFSLKKIRTFCRNEKIAAWIVAHPQKQYKDEKGNYKRVTLYDISGSAHWYNKADNGIVVFRDENDKTEIYIDKVKFRYYGKKGKVDMNYIQDWRGYEEPATQKQINDYDMARMK